MHTHHAYQAKTNTHMHILFPGLCFFSCQDCRCSLSSVTLLFCHVRGHCIDSFPRGFMSQSNEYSCMACRAATATGRSLHACSELDNGLNEPASERGEARRNEIHLASAKHCHGNRHFAGVLLWAWLHAIISSPPRSAHLPVISSSDLVHSVDSGRDLLKSSVG